MIDLFFLTSGKGETMREVVYAIHAQVYLNGSWMGCAFIEEVSPLWSSHDVVRRRAELARDATLAWKEDLLMQCLL